ncbi:hypothetical protein D3C81_1928530 [compost metagenome]
MHGLVVKLPMRLLVGGQHHLMHLPASEFEGIACLDRFGVWVQGDDSIASVRNFQ